MGYYCAKRDDTRFDGNSEWRCYAKKGHEGVHDFVQLGPVLLLKEDGTYEKVFGDLFDITYANGEGCIALPNNKVLLYGEEQKQSDYPIGSVVIGKNKAKSGFDIKKQLWFAEELMKSGDNKYK